MPEKSIFPKDFQKYVREHTRIGIKGGETRESFLPIWIVEVENRYFSRSWNKSSRSWFTEFLESGVGQIKYEDHVINVQGQKLSSQDPLQQKIDKAYLHKYDQEENLFYSKGIT